MATAKAAAAAAKAKHGLMLMLCMYRLGHNTRHFNVGNYRRHQKSEEMAQDATFFDHSNEVGSSKCPTRIRTRAGAC